MVLPERARLTRARRDARSHPAGDALVAGAAHDLAAALLDAGRTREAAKAAREAVRAWRGVFDADPEYYAAELAGSLVVLFRARWATRPRRAEARAALAEAVALYRGLAGTWPRATLAAVRHDAAVRMAAAGRFGEALRHAAAATGRAEYLETLARIHGRLGHLGAAVAAQHRATEAWRGRRSLLDDERARALLELARLAARAGRRLEAAAHAHEAVLEYRTRMRFTRMLRLTYPAAEEQRRTLRTATRLRHRCL